MAGDRWRWQLKVCYRFMLWACGCTQGRFWCLSPQTKTINPQHLLGRGGGGFSYCCGNKMVSKHLIRAINHLTINHWEKQLFWAKHYNIHLPTTIFRSNVDLCLFADDQWNTRTCTVTSRFSNFPCNELSNTKTITKPYLGNGFAGSCSETAAVGGSRQTGVAVDTVCKVTVRLPMPI